MLGYRVTTAVALAGLALAVLVLLPATASVMPTLIESGGVSAALLTFSSVLLLITAGYARANLAGQSGYRRFGWLMAVAGAGLLLVMATGSPVAFALGWTVSGWAAAILVGHAGDQPARRARNRMMRWMGASDALMWSAVVAAWLGGIDLFGPADLAPLTILLAVLLLGAGVSRSALVPARGWLMGTLEAPTPVSALLHAGVVAGLGVLLVRIPLLQSVNWLIAVVGIVTVGAALVTMRHRHDEKGKLATGTSMQMAFMSLEGITGLPGLVLIHMAGHGSYKAWSFLRASGAPARWQQQLVVASVRSSRATGIAALGAIALAAAAVAAFGLTEALNWVVGAVAVFSALAFALRLNGRPRMILVLVTVLAFAGYVLVIRAAAIAFGTQAGAPTWMIVVCALALPATALAITLLPKALTRRWAAWANGTWQRFRDDTSGAVDLNGHLDVRAITDTATSWIPGSRPLSNFVADNPLASLEALDFESAAGVAGRLGIPLHPTPRQYLALLEDGHIDRDHLVAACGSPEGAQHLIDRTTRVATTWASQACASTADKDRLAMVASWWCADAWRTPSSRAGCYSLWRDAHPSRHRTRLPVDPAHAIAVTIHRRGLNDVQGAHLLLQAAAMLDVGWLQVARAKGDDQVLEVLALRLQLADAMGVPLTLDAAPTFEGAPLWQAALESTFHARMSEALAIADVDDSPSSIAVVTCIDVRSDVLRTAAEQRTGVETFGMAGFFGADVEIASSHGQDRLCPIILDPATTLADRRAATAAWAAPSLWHAAGRGIGGLALAEGFGLLCAAAAAVNTWLPGVARSITAHFSAPSWSGETAADMSGVDLDRRVELARRILDVVPIQRFDHVVFVGHGSQAPNTAFASAYQCGACGGHSGRLNARVAAALLNDPEVRDALARTGSDVIGTDAWAACHDTTLGSAELDPLYEDAAPEPVRSLIESFRWLPRRSAPLQPVKASGHQAQARATAWWQVFPEWGLAGNGACVIGPRALTRASDLGSRVFLHDYDWTTDPTGEVLLGILSGPGVVMHMINMQYYLSTVAPEIFGSGDKTRQNVVGEAGVVMGAGGRLRLGLPWQALTTSPGTTGHVPVRLQIYVAAPQEVVDSVLARSPLALPVANEWLRVHAIVPHAGPRSTTQHRLTPSASPSCEGSDRA